MTTEKPRTLADMGRELGRQLSDALQAMSDALTTPSPTEPVDVATARDQVVTAALRYAAAEGDAGTSLADTNAALETLDDALAGYVDATGWQDKAATVPAEEALKPGNTVEFTVRGEVAEGCVQFLDNRWGDYAAPGSRGSGMDTPVIAKVGRDFRVIRRAEAIT